MSARAWMLALLLLAAGQPARVHADEPGQNGALDGCVEGALPALRPEPFVSAFLIAPAAKSRGFALPATGCVGFVAVGGAGIQLVELGVHTEDGATLATALRLGPAARIEYCGTERQSMVLTAQVKSGRGMLYVFRIDGGLRHLHAELAVLDACQSSSLAGNAALADIGVGPAPVEAAERLAAANADDLDAGAEFAGPPVTLGVDEHETVRTVFHREEPGCFVVIAEGTTTLHALTASVVRRGGETVASIRSARSSLRLPFCIDAPGSFAVSLRADVGRGDVAARWLRFREPSGALLPGMEGPARAEFARLAAQFGTYGLVARPHAWMHLRNTDRLVARLPVAAGACVALSTVQRNTDGAIDLTIESDGGRVLAFRRRFPGDPPVSLHVCTERADTLRVVVSGASAAPTLALLVVGEAPP